MSREIEVVMSNASFGYIYVIAEEEAFEQFLDSFE